MQSNLSIAWRHMTASDFLEQRIAREVAGLEKTFGRITACQVTVEGPGQKHRQGGRYAVHIKLELPGRAELIVSRDPAAAAEHADAYVAARDAFQALRRQLREHARQRRASSPSRDARGRGVIARMAAEDGYGFITADDGREIYFHQNAVLDPDFASLRAGAEVHFAEADGENEPQASSVRAFGPGSRKRLRLASSHEDRS